MPDDHEKQELQKMIDEVEENGYAEEQNYRRKKRDEESREEEE